VGVIFAASALVLLVLLFAAEVTLVVASIRQLDERQLGTRSAIHCAPEWQEMAGVIGTVTRPRQVGTTRPKLSHRKAARRGSQPRGTLVDQHVR
jgi:hypothetical protein